MRILSSVREKMIKLKEKLKNRIKYSKIFQAFRKIIREKYENKLWYVRLYSMIRDIKEKERYVYLKKNMVSIIEYCERYDIEYSYISKDKKCMICGEHFWHDEAEKKNHEVQQPDILWTILHDVNVIGGNSCILCEKEVIMENYNERSSRLFCWTNSNLILQENDLGLFRMHKEKKELDCAINLCGVAYENYFHFMTENLAKFAVIEKNEIGKDYPIIVDKGIKSIPSFLEALNIINVHHHPIIWAETGDVYNIRELLYVSPSTCLPINMKGAIMPNDVDYAMYRGGLDFIKSIAKKKSKYTGCDKIYVTRLGNKNKRLINDKELAELCEEHGFKVIRPEKMSFIDQVSYFSSAKIILSCTGAACTNAMFCEENTQIYIFIPREHNGILWSTFIENANVNVTFIPAKIIKKDYYSAGDQFLVDTTMIKELLMNID